MYQGFYNLTSGMLTQSRNLNVISNNMVNLETAGYKKDTMVSSTFGEEMLYRIGRHTDQRWVEMGQTSKISTADRVYVSYEQGALHTTDGLYDFAIQGKGFFRIQTNDGPRYTRNGSFAVDAQGYLTLSGIGRVMDTNNRPIRIDNENFTVDSSGTIYVTDNVRGTYVAGTIKLVDFADYNALHKEDNGVFSTNQAEIIPQNSSIMWKTVERSNVNLIDEMTSMMASQRALQSAAQVLKMYDQVMGKASTEVGRL